MLDIPGMSQKQLLTVNKVTNGWVVTINNANRDKETSAEAVARQEAEKLKKREADLEHEKARLRKDIDAQLAGMKLVGEAVAKAQDKKLESWKYDEDEEDFQSDDSLEDTITKLAEANIDNRSPFLGFVSPYDSLSIGVETHVFTDRQEMISFVTRMLEPLVE